MMNWIGICISFVFVFAVIGISTLLSQKGVLDGEGSRKFIHVAVSNWWIIAMIFFDSPWFASFVPLMFVFINYASYRQNIFKAMERDGSQRDLGTVYYAISLLVLAFITFSANVPYLGGIGILVMGYGDGFAALIGKKYGKTSFKKYGFDKSLEGSLTVFAFSLIIAGIFFAMYSPMGWFWKAPALALAAMIVELLSPNGFDNLTLPLTVSALAWALVTLL